MPVGMGLDARAIIEYWEREQPPDGARPYKYWGQYHVPSREVALELYALSGLRDPAYDLKDLSLLGRERYERDQQLGASRPIKIEGSEVQAAFARLKAPGAVYAPLRVALETVERLGPRTRLVFWMTT